MNKRKINFGLKYFILYSIIFFLITFIISFFISFVLEKRIRTVKFDEIKANETQTIGLELELLGNEFGMIIADLNYLSRMLSDELAGEGGCEQFVDNWQEFSLQKGVYDQIRYIDSEGQEKLSINLGNGNTYLTAKEQLKDKSDAYYFIETSMLEEGSIYISPLDLSNENGIIEVPYEPMIRFCAPIYDGGGELSGVLVLNYLAENILINFKKIAAYSNGELVLLNSNGDWLSSNQASREWNFMFEGREALTFSWFFPEWADITQGPGQLLTENGLFTYNFVDLSSKIRTRLSEPDRHIKLGDGNWYIVSLIQRLDENKALFADKTLPVAQDTFMKYLVLYAVVFIISLVVGYLFYLYMKAYRQTKIYSKYDSLTKLLNRRAGTEALNKLLFQDERRKAVFSVCFLDVNGLKHVNDILGHKVGDELIMTVASIIKDSIREEDFVARMGGDEFLIVFNGIDAELAEVVWSRIYLLFEKINSEENRPYIISVSHGIAGYTSGMGTVTSEELIKHADALMYAQKRQMKKGLDVIRGMEKEQ